MVLYAAEQDEGIRKANSALTALFSARHSERDVALLQQRLTRLPRVACGVPDAGLHGSRARGGLAGGRGAAPPPAVRASAARGAAGTAARVRNPPMPTPPSPAGSPRPRPRRRSALSRFWLMQSVSVGLYMLDPWEQAACCAATAAAALGVAHGLRVALAKAAEAGWFPVGNATAAVLS